MNKEWVDKKNKIESEKEFVLNDVNKNHMCYAGIDMSNWDFTFNEDDNLFIYKAFIALCNYLEDRAACEACPLRDLCFSTDGKKFWNMIYSKLNERNLEEKGDT